jgi:prepilin-type N-terminal cleavage/methylation domain-containing protein
MILCQANLSRKSAAFSLIEMMISIGIVGIAVSAMAVFTEMTTRSMASITQQTLSNQEAGQFAAFLTQRVRGANFMTNNAAETEILLAFDDDPDVDSDSDDNSYNDRDHYELFSFVDGDDNPATLPDNRLLFSPNTNLSLTVSLADSGVKYLPGTNLFVMGDHPPGTTNGYRTVHINVGIYHEEGMKRTQTIEMKTSAFRRN